MSSLCRVLHICIRRILLDGRHLLRVVERRVPAVLHGDDVLGADWMGRAQPQHVRRPAGPDSDRRSVQELFQQLFDV